MYFVKCFPSPLFLFFYFPRRPAREKIVRVSRDLVFCWTRTTNGESRSRWTEHRAALCNRQEQTAFVCSVMGPLPPSDTRVRQWTARTSMTAMRWISVTTYCARRRLGQHRQAGAHPPFWLGSRVKETFTISFVRRYILFGSKLVCKGTAGRMHQPEDETSNTRRARRLSSYQASTLVVYGHRKIGNRHATASATLGFLAS